MAQLKIEYWPLKKLVPLKGNSKKHATENTIRSIKKHGFRDPIGIDMTLNKGKGAIVEGHDRRAALIELKRLNSEPPEGIQVDSNGDWLVPVLTGIDAKNEAQAIAYSIEHNLSTIKGAGLDPIEEIKLFDGELLLEQAEYLDEHGESIDSIDLDWLREALSGESNEPDDDSIPDDNRDIDEEALGETKHRCPNCNFEW